MNIPGLFISRPIATTLLTLGLALAGIVAFFLLPVAPLPNTDFPVISVSASLPGASPETMSTSVATPLERHLGAIADVNEMTSSSSAGSARVTLQFNIDRDIDGAARDVQAAINAARVDLPAALKSNPTYRKINPADFPIMILALTSKTLTGGQIYDSASTVLQQMLSQVSGVGDVQVGGSSLPAVRVELNPHALFKYGIGLEDVRAALSAANANAPKGAVEDSSRRYQLYVNDTASTAKDYANLIVAWRDNAPVRVSDIEMVYDGVENVRNIGLANGDPAILLVISKQPGANVIQTVDRVSALLPQMQAAIPPTIHLAVVNDTTTTIRASVRDVERTLVMATILVLLVVLFFLRTLRAALVPSLAVPLSILGTFAVMYMLGYSLDNFSLMALTISTGFVVDDAIVVLENVTRHVEAGMPRRQAAILGAQEVSFTVLAMSVSLIAVFLPILLLGGIIGRLFHEFAVTLATAIIVSLIISLTTTPMMCAYISTGSDETRENFAMRGARAVSDGMHRFYQATLGSALRHPLFTVVVLLATVGLNFYLYGVVSKGFFPQEDSGSLSGNIQADQAISFQAMEKKFQEFVTIIHADPAVLNVVGFSGGGGGGPRGGGATNSGQVFVQLKPLAERKLTTDQIIARLRPKLQAVAGAVLRLQGRQDVRSGGRSGNSQFQYTIEADTLQDLQTWVPKITNALQDVNALEDVNSDKQDKGLEVDLKIDRATASRLGINPTQIDNTLYDAFGQRQVSTIYNELNQYHVVMEVAPEFWQSPDTLQDIYISTSGGALNGTQSTGAVAGTTVLSNTLQPTAAAIASDAQRNQQLNAIANTARGSVSTGSAVSSAAETMIPLAAIGKLWTGYDAVINQSPRPICCDNLFLQPADRRKPRRRDGRDPACHGRDPCARQRPWRVCRHRSAFHAIPDQHSAPDPGRNRHRLYRARHTLRELCASIDDPFHAAVGRRGSTARDTLSSSGFQPGLLMIAVILLIGIVKKNAIMMIDFAIQAQREGNLSAHDAISKAAVLRFRPIMMTTFAALLGSLPLAISSGEGAELRKPLGVAIVGGLIVSQILTLYTTPVVYLYLERFRVRTKRGWDRFYSRLLGDAPPAPAE